VNFDHTEKTKAIVAEVQAFMDEHIYPNQERYKRELNEGDTRFKVIPIVEELKDKAKAANLWNMALPPHSGVDPVNKFEFNGPGQRLTNLEYAAVAEVLGPVPWAPEVFNCSAPDVGNMEVLLRYGTKEQQEQWLRPLMNGDIRTAFLMTEPAVASSDATNVQTSIVRDGDHYVINGRKWWSSGVGDPRCKIAILLGKTDFDAPRHQQQSQILVPLDTPGVKIERMLTFFGYDEAPHGAGEVVLDNVRVPVENILLGEGRGFEIAQGRLGPGRIHHSMRTVGIAERALEMMVKRLLSREVFGKKIAQHSVWEERIANARTELEMMRLLCLKAAHMMDTKGNKSAKNEVGMIKLAAPRIVSKILDDAIQAFGGAGVSQDTDLAFWLAGLRTFRLADGPDEVHAMAIARAEMKKYR
jgi:alkylation response protein AidB-like acyl-CoA dehydrogenase